MSPRGNRDLEVTEPEHCRHHHLVRHDADPAPGGGVEEAGVVVPEDVTGGGHVPSEDAGEVEERSLLHID